MLYVKLSLHCANVALKICREVKHVCNARLGLAIIGRQFESCLGTIAQWPWASYLHLCASVTKQYNLVPVKGQ